MREKRKLTKNGTVIMAVMVSLASCQRQGGLDIAREKTDRFQKRANEVLGRHVNHMSSEVYRAAVGRQQNYQALRAALPYDSFGFPQDLAFSPYQFQNTYGIPWGKNPYGPSVYSDYRERARRCIETMSNIPKIAVTYGVAMVKLSQCLASLVYTQNPAFNWMFEAGDDPLRQKLGYAGNFPITALYNKRGNNIDMLELIALLRALEETK